jgi:hypothetical protein
MLSKEDMKNGGDSDLLLVRPPPSYSATHSTYSVHADLLRTRHSMCRTVLR